jgi:cytochrome c peroxidase
MNSSRLYVAQRIWAQHRAEYEAIFGAIPAPLDDPGRFPQLTAERTGCASLDAANRGVDCHGVPGDKAEYDGLSPADRDVVTRVVVNAGKAIGAYERLLACGPGRFDRWMHGDASALSPSEQRGAVLFVGAGKCAGCHAGPFLSDQKFHNVGLAPMAVAAAFLDADDRGAAAGVAEATADELNTKGRYSDGDDGRLTAAVAPEGAFRTPTLRCVGQRPSFFHTGQAITLETVVEHFDDGGHLGGFVGEKEIAPLALSAGQRRDLVAFLRALDGPGAPRGLTAP